MADNVNNSVQPISPVASTVPVMLNAPPLVLPSGVQITGDLLLKPCPLTKSHQIANDCATALTKWLPKHGVTNALMIVLMLGQMAEESDHWKTLTEYASGHEYEMRRDLGNVRPGWGVLFKGRGPIQITGHLNYAHYGPEVIDPETGKLGVDLLTHPEKAATADIGVQIAIRYCIEHRFVSIAQSNSYSLEDKIEVATRKVNGGVNGLAERRKMTLEYKTLLGA